jgi:O-antigen ligase
MTDGQRLAVGLVAALGLLVAGRMQSGKAGRGVRWLVLLALGIQAVAFVVNFKRGSWIAALLAIGIFVLIKVKWKGLLLLGALVVASLCMPPVQHRIAALKTEFDPYHGGRMTMWLKIAPELLRQHPWGVGYRSVTNEMMREIAPEVEADRTHLHSNIVELLVTTGWLGLAIYLAWMGVGLRDGGVFFRRAREGDVGEKTLALALLLMLAALLLNGLVEYNFGDAELVLIYGFVMGCSAAGFKRCVSS